MRIGNRGFARWKEPRSRSAPRSKPRTKRSWRRLPIICSRFARAATRSTGRRPLRTASRATPSIRRENSPGNSENSGAADRTDARLGLKRPPLIDARAQAREIETGPRQAGVARSVFDEAIRYADVQQGQLQSGGGEHFADAR